ncbi:MAG: ATP-binding protein [Gammaproteobacteria bacterium]|nr:ATP-binding protein [Gammaproteobacteria bacterium]
MNKVTTIRFQAIPKKLCGLREKAREAIQQLGFNNDTEDFLVIAINEACMNVIQHAYCDKQGCEIVLEIFNSRTEATFRLTDFAPLIDPDQIQSRNLNEIKPGGLGVHIINEVMDQVEYRHNPQGTGNILIMIKNKPAQESHHEMRD